LLLAPVLGEFWSDRFCVDRELIAGAGRAVRMSQVRQAVREYFSDPGNRHWLRRRLNFRLSAKRLMLLAIEHLPGDSAQADQ